ncbi:hypothetical protein WMF01_47705 [Sorangium sp. So ce1667]
MSCTGLPASGAELSAELARILQAIKVFLAHAGPPPCEPERLLVLGQEGVGGAVVTLRERSSAAVALVRAGDPDAARALAAPVPNGAVRVAAVASDGSYRTALVWWPSTAERINASGGCA